MVGRDKSYPIGRGWGDPTSANHSTLTAPPFPSCSLSRLGQILVLAAALTAAGIRTWATAPGIA